MTKRLFLLIRLWEYQIQTLNHLKVYQVKKMNPEHRVYLLDILEIFRGHKSMFPRNSVMESQKITMLKDLDVNSTDFTVKVAIIRLWKLASRHDANQTFRIEMIVVDENGTRMQSTCEINNLPRFEPVLEQGACLLIRNPSLGANSSVFKYVDNPLKICFFYKTKVEKCNDLFGSLYGISPISFTAILDKTAPLNETFDVIGSVVRYYDTINKVGTNGKDTQRKTMEVEDLEGNSIFVTLFDAYEQQFSKYISDNPDCSQIVIIVQFGKLQYFGGKPYVSNVYNVTRVFINDDIDEIELFKKSLLLKSGKEISSTSRRSTSSLSYSIRDDFLVNNDFHNVIDILELVNVKSVIIMATIKYVDQHMQWYYDACNNCARKVTRQLVTSDEPEGSIDIDHKYEFQCKTPRCAHQVISVVPRFKIPIRVQDSTGIISVTLFDREATKIFQKTAKDLLEKYLEGGYQRLLPDELYDLVEKTYAFKIEVTDYNVKNNCQVYTVSKMTDDTSVMAELTKKINVGEPVDSVPFNFISRDVASQEMEVGSYTSDNTTPVSNLDKMSGNRHFLNEKMATRKVEKGELKRNLCDIYDVDDHVSGSAIKGRPSVLDGEKLDGKLKLITPKLEK